MPEDSSVAQFFVGQIVEVAARTWPGINKHGGVGKITKIHTNDDTIVAVDVRYTIAGGGEKNIEAKYVKPAPRYGYTRNNGTGSGLRDRNCLLGRCKRCGSLRTDCGSCDWRIGEEEPPEERPNRKSSPTKRRKVQEYHDSSTDDSMEIPISELRKEHGKHKNYSMGSENYSSSDEGGGQLVLSARNRRQFNRKSIADSSSSSDESSDEEIIRTIQQKKRMYRRHMNFLNKYLKLRKSNQDTRRTKTNAVPIDSLQTIGPIELNKKQKVKQPSRDDGFKGENNGEKQINRLRRDAVSNDANLHMMDTVSDENLSSGLGGSISVDEESYQMGNIGTQDLSQVSDRSSSGADSPTSIPSSPLKGSSASTHRLSSPELSPIKESRAISSPTSRERIMLVDNDLGGFIQPEGTARFLPEGTVDKSAELSIVELPQFFETTLNNIQDAIPDAQMELANIQRKVTTAYEKKAPTIELENKCTVLFERCMKEFVRDGIDQCRACTDRLESRKIRREAKCTLSKKQRMEIFGDIAEFRRDSEFHRIQREVEDLMFQIRKCLNSFHDDDLEDLLSQPESDVCDEESVEPRQPQDESIRIAMPSDLPDFDSHMYATKGRKPSSRRKDRNSKNPQQTKRRSRNRNRGRTHSKNQQGEGLRFDERECEGCNSDGGDSSAMEKMQMAASTTGYNAPSRKRRKRQQNTLERRLQKSAVGHNKGDQGAPNDDSQVMPFANDDDDDDPMHDFSDAPRLEDLLRDGSRHQFQNLSDNVVHRESKTSAADRMEAWIDANAQVGMVDEPDGLVQQREKVTNRRHRGHQSEPRPQSQHPRSGARGHQENEIVSSTVLFDRLRKDTNRIYPRPAPNRSDLSASCQSLLSAYPHMPSDDRRLLHMLKQKYASTSTSDVSRDDVVHLFQSSHTLLLKTPLILIEIIHQNREDVYRQVDLFSFVLDQIGAGLGSRLTPDDDVIYMLFGGNHPVFVESVLHQCIDLLYGKLNPKAWTTAICSTGLPILSILKPMRDSLSKVIPLFETFSKFIFSRVGSQQWRKSSCGKFTFVSSIEPGDYQALLRSGSIYSRPEKVRFKQFGQKIPRAEVESLWSMIAFFVETSSIPSSSANCSWRLLSALLLSDAGVLSEKFCGSRMQNEAAINPKHLCKCRDELSNLNFLVSTGLMNPLPNDKVITKLLLHAMSLEMQSISSGLGKLYDFDMVSYEDGPLRLWKHSDPSITSEFICDDREPVSLEINGISKCCLDLVSAWRNNLPAGRARTKRFNRAIDGCISQLEKYAMEQGGNNKEGTDDFAAAFGRQTEPGDNGGATAKAYLKVFQGEVNRRSFGGSTTRISMDDVLSVWKVVATTKLLASQERILHRSCGCSLAPGDSYHQMNALIGKIIYDSIMNLIQTLATTDGVNNTSSVDRPEARVISCWAALLESVSSGQNQVSSLRDEKISDESLAFCYWTCQISFACRHAIDSLHSQQRETMVIIAKSMFEMTTGPLAAYFVRLLNITDQNSARMCLRSCLASLRSLSSLLAVAKTKPAVESQSPTESDNAEEDLFGDIDDEAFLALEMPDQSTAYEAMEPAATLWKHFSTLLKLSKPSNVYAVLPIGGFEEWARETSSSCRNRAGRFSGGIASFLASLVPCLTNGDHLIDKGLDERFANVPSISSVFAGNDCAFGRDVTFCFYGELCRLGAKHFSCTSVLRRRFDDCFQIFILGLLDSNSLERFPSCDMAAWEKLANGKGKEKEERHLSYANPSEPSADILRGLSVPLALKKREEYDHAGAAYISRNLWVFFQTLKEVSKAVDGDSGKFGAVVAKLTVTSNHLLHKFSGSLWPVSLEMEYHRRRQLLKGILAECLHLDLTEFLFNILRELIAHLLYILDGAAVIADERTSFQDGSSSALTHKQAKLHFLQNLQAEFVAEFFSLLWLKNTKYGEHDKNRQLGKKMIDFISLLCERDSTGQTMESFRGHLSKLLGTSFPETNSKLEHKLKVDLLLCICKRAPRLFLSSVAHEKMMDNILSTLCSSHLKIDDQERSHSLGAFTDALSVPRRAGRLFLPSSNCSTILGHHLGVLMSEEVAYALRSRSAQGRIQEARCCALGKIFPRKLGNNQLSFKSREIIVQLTGRLMKAHNDEIRSDSLCHLLDTKDLATLLQNIVRCIIDSFKTLTEDELSIFLCSAFEGISLLLQTQVDGDDRRSFIECIRRDSRDISSSEVEVINIENKDKLIYFRVWVDSLLMRKLCIALTTLENLEEDISLLFSEWPEVESLPPVTRSSSFRVLLQTREFLLRIKKHRQNVYAQRKSLSVRNSSDLLGWKPESPVIRAAKKVLATVDAIP